MVKISLKLKSSIEGLPLDFLEGVGLLRSVTRTLCVTLEHSMSVILGLVESTNVVQKYVSFFIYWFSYFGSSLLCVGHSWLRCTGFSLRWLPLLRSTGCKRAQVSAAATGGPPSMQAPAVMVRGLSCPAACGIFLDWGLNTCPLHWRVVSYPPGKSRSMLLSLHGFGARLTYTWRGQWQRAVTWSEFLFASGSITLAHDWKFSCP